MKEQVRKLPRTPGVYIFRDKKGKVLYVGKATSLRSRVGSYFGGRNGVRIESMVALATTINVKKTDSVLEALILESNLIKEYRPKYNVEKKDDKSFSHFVITKDEFPRVIIKKETDLDGMKDNIQKSFGPYTSLKQMKIALKIIQKIFPFHSVKQRTEKGCLDYQTGRCPGPYADKISKKEYRKNIQGIKMVLEGKKSGLIRKMKKEMKAYSQDHEFEKAAEIRNSIFALEHIQDVALISNEKMKETEGIELRIEAYDISNISGKYATGSMVVFKGNCPEKNEYRKFRIKTIDTSNDVGMMREILERRFNNKWPNPDLILLDGGRGHLNAIRGLLSDLKLKISTVAVAKGARRKNLVINGRKEIGSGGVREVLTDKRLIKQIMDEAHRFAISYHKNLRHKGMLK